MNFDVEIQFIKLIKKVETKLIIYIIISKNYNICPRYSHTSLRGKLLTFDI